VVQTRRDRAIVVTVIALVVLRSALLGGVALMFLYLAGALSGRAFAAGLAVLVVLGVLMGAGHLRLARRAGR